MTATVGRLRAELRDDCDHVATATPRLTWTVETDEPNWRQRSAELSDGTTMVELETDASVLVDWPFSPLRAGERREVTVRVTAESGSVTSWSDPVVVEAGFLDRWVALPIGLADPERPAQPALLRHRFLIERPVRRARLFWTALGVAEIELDGVPVDDAVLSPGWTGYRDRLVHETVDVTVRLVPGTHVLAASLAGGWYTEEYGFQGFVSRFYGEQPSLLAQLEIEYEDGTTETIATGEGWEARGDGPILSSGIYAGEHYDARARVPSQEGWTAARIGGVDAPRPEARVAPPVRRIEELPVLEVLRSPGGATVLDFGQNLVGRLRIRVSGPEGTRITLRHAEVLERGELALAPLRRADATDVYVLAGEGDEVWEPQFTFHGFRYAQVDGWPGELDPLAITAVVVHSDMARTGWFSSSDPLLDRLHENVVWGMRGNFLSIPTDCPQRDERLGWTGDLEVFSPTASFLYDCAGFLVSWLRDLALEQQRGDGIVPLVVPSVLPGLGTDSPVAAWGDAATVVPWVLFERFGDRGVLRDQYASMCSWADVLLAASDGTGLWAGTFQLGDWLDPSAPPDHPERAKADPDIVASAYLARSLRIVADTASVLGETADAERFGAEAERAREAFLAEYVTPAGRMVSDAPTAYALALRFDLATEAELRHRLAARLADLVRAGGYRIATGFVGTPIIADALSDSGHLDRAERLLMQTENPSWLYPVTMGATTVWERWDSMLPDGTVNPGEMTSFNHYALGSVADWLHRVVAGLAPGAPGYRRILIAPQPLRALQDASARHITPYGVASTSWRRTADGILVEAEVPPNTTAVVALPGREPLEVGSGRHEWTVPAASTPTPNRVGLDSSTASVIDEPRAYRAVLETIAHHDPDRAEAVRRDTVWTEGRTLRQSLLFTPTEVLDDIAVALAEL